MNNESNTIIQFYQNLGKLFYAFAAIDNSVKKEELNKLIEIVDNNWKIIKHFDNNARDAIINTFKWLNNEKEYTAEMCYNSFIEFKNTHKALFNTSITKLILMTASKITASFSGQNKSEVILLAKLDLELKR